MEKKLYLFFLLFICLLFNLLRGHAQVIDTSALIISSKTNTDARLQSLTLESKINKNWLENGIFNGHMPSEEILETRTENSKKFRRSDGKVEIIFGGPFHFIDKNGAFQDIDLSIKTQHNTLYKYVNRENIFETQFSERVMEGAQISYNQNSISIGINFEMGGATWRPKKNEGKSSTQIIENQISYQNIYENVNLQYQLNTNDLQHRVEFLSKEVFNGLNDSYLELSEELQIPINSYLFDANGPITKNRLTKGEIFLVVQNDTIFTLLESRIWDANASQFDGFFLGENSIAFLATGKIKLISRIPKKWLLSSERAYPIVFDPTVYIGGFNSFSNNYRYPFNTCRVQRVSQMLFLAKDMNNIKGQITEIAFLKNSNNPMRNNNLSISFKEINYSSFTISSLETGLTQAFYSPSVSFQSGGTGWQAFTLSTPFNYTTNNRNLLIETRFNNCGLSPTSCPSQNSSNSGHSPGGQWGYLNASYNGHRWAFSDNCNTPPSGVNPAPVIEANPGFGNFIPAVRLIIAAPTCSGWTVTPSSRTLSGDAQNSSFTVGVTTGSNCQYGISSNFPNWITNVSGNGATVSFSVSRNTTGTARQGSISITSNGLVVATFTITQNPSDFVSAGFRIAPSPPNYINSLTYFYDESTGSPAPNEWNWNFGDGNTSNIKDPQHRYTRLGQFTVSLTVKNSRGNSSIFTRVINITSPPPPVADFFSDKNNITPGTTVNFFDNSRNGPATYNWSFNGGTPSTSTSANPTSIRYNIPGVYRVELTVGNNSGQNSITKRGFITVSPNGTNQLNPPPRNAINGQWHQYICADPIQVGTATYAYKHTDFEIPVVNGAISFSRFYNSLNASIDGPLGFGWSHSYNYYLDNQQDTLWVVNYPDGHIESFVPLFNGDGKSFPLYSGSFDSLKKNSGNDFTLFSVNNLRYNFNASGQLVQIIDLNGNTTNLNYSGNRLATITGPGGRSLSLNYNNAGRISRITDPLSRNINYTYDGNGNLVAVKDAKGFETTFTYDVRHLILVVKNPLNEVVVDNTYDSQRRIINQKDAFNEITRFAYNTPTTGESTITNPDNSKIVVHHDNFYRKTTVKDELGNVEKYGYDFNSNQNSFANLNGHVEARQFDRKGNLLRREEPGNVATQIVYNAFNSPIRITDAEGNVTTMVYDAKNNLISIVRPDNTTESFENNVRGQLVKHTDARGNSITLVYSSFGDLISTTSASGTKTKTNDNAGRLISERDERNNMSYISYDDNDNIINTLDALNNSISYTYDANNQLLTITDKMGGKTTFTYDKKGRLKTKTDARGGVTIYSYDNRDNLTTVADPKNNVTTYAYNEKGRKISMTNALGTTRYEYDKFGNLLKTTDPTNITTIYTYTVNNRMATINDGLNNATSFTYDKNGNLLSTTNPLGDVTRYRYDKMNRLTSVIDAANVTSRVEYDNNGNRTAVVDPNGNRQTYAFDAMNRLIRHTDADGNIYRFTYDAAGNNLQITKPTGTIAKGYDALNRVISVNNSTGNNYQFEYDKNDNIVLMGNSAGNTRLEYNSLNQMVKYTDPFNKQVLFEYDPAGNRTAVTYSGNRKVQYTYDAVNNIKTVTDWLNKVFTYTYDAAGRNTKLAYPNGVNCLYTFDKAGRLITKQNVLPAGGIINSSQFNLDANSNRIEEVRQGPIPSYLLPASRKYEYAKDDRMLTDSIWTFVNDNAGNRLSETKGAKKATYTFSVDNQLLTIVDTLGVNNSFTYNPMGNRIAKTAGNTTSRFVLDISDALSKVLQITDGSGVIKSHYIYGNGLLEQIDAAGNPMYYHFDAQHNTTALTDATAAIKDTYTYDPFGTMLSHTGSSAQPYALMGEFGVEQENSTLHYVRARYYDAANGRFLGKDEFPDFINSPQTLNRFVYSTNNPISNFDPSGLISFKMLATGILQSFVGNAESAQAYVYGKAAVGFAGSGLLAPLAPLAGAAATKHANEAIKNYKVAGDNIINSFKKGSTIADAKFVEDANVSGLRGLDAFFEQKEIKTSIEIFEAMYAIKESYGFLKNLKGNFTNYNSARIYLKTLPNFAKEATSQNLAAILDGLVSMHDGSISIFKLLNSNSKK